MKKAVWNKLFAIGLSVAVAVTGFAGGFASPKRAEASGEAITVAQAISKKSGTAAVEGYIVAHTTGTNSYDTIAPFGNDYNFALADSASETSAANIMPVKLDSAFRSTYGLKTNPSLIGTKVRVTGALKEYFSVPGMQNVTAMEFVSGGGEPGGGGPGGENPGGENPGGDGLLTIAEARTRSVTTDVYVQGVVLADNAAIGAGKLNTFIYDGTAGINLYNNSDDGFPALEAGDLVRVRGKLVEYRNLLEIVPAAGGITVVSEGALPTPQSIEIADLSDEYEGELVTLKAYVTSKPGSPSGGGYNVSAIDNAFKGTTIRVMEGTNAIGSLELNKWYHITGVAGQYDSYQVFPRSAADIVLADPQDPKPMPSQQFTESTVASVHDGDTIHLQSPVLGATKVRMLSMDTPELTYEGQSQGAYAELATNELKKLLPAGQKVSVEVGAEPFDAYGRLLAHVWLVDDEGNRTLDVNREMVRLGMAVPYFIYPNLEHFEEYSEAGAEAIANGNGIWNPSNPIDELPYEFRFNLRNGPDKYVGDYFTKKYVEPDEWESINAENRVFFFEESDAIAAGYAKQGTEPTENIKLQLLSVNDLHGKIDQTYEVEGQEGVNLGRMDYVAAYLKQRESQEPNTWIVHPGDMVGGSSPISALFQDEPTVQLMESIGFDVGTVGNHELDEGTAEMLRLINGGDHPNGTANYDGIDFPMVAANMVYKANGETVLDPYTILEVEGVKVGFIGIVTPATANMVIPEGIQDIRFTDPADAVNEAVAELEAQGVKAIVVLAHLDATQAENGTITGPSADLANEVNDQVDIIFAAHNHMKVNGLVDDKLIVQGWEYGKAFVDVDVEISPTTKDIVSKEAEIVDVVQSAITPDADAAAILDHYGALVEPILNEVVGVAAKEMTGKYGVKGVIGDNAIGNMLADGMKAAMNSDFALMNGGGIRDTIDAGDITWGELFNVQPFNNVLVKVTITGADLRAIMNAQLTQQFGPDYSISGFKYTWDGATTKVVDLLLPNGTPINENAEYTLTVNNFMLTATGDKYLPIGQLSENPITGPEDLEATVAFVKSFSGPLDYEAEGRISEIVVNPGIPKVMTVAEARAAAAGTAAIVEGIATSASGGWGNKGFYLQDATGGLYAFQNTIDVAAGDKVKVTGKTGEFNQEFQLADAVVEKLGTEAVPTPLTVSPGQVGAGNSGQLVEIQGATISNLKSLNSYGTFEFLATKGAESVLVRVDNRTGLKFDNFAFENGDVVNVKGISSNYNTTVQLKPRGVADVVEGTASTDRNDVEIVGPDAAKPGETFTLTIQSPNAHEMYGFDLEIVYDPAILTLLDNGIGMHGDVQGWFPLEMIDDNGTIHATATMTGEAPGLTGDIGLIELRFAAKQTLGSTAVKITTKSVLADASMALYEVEREIAKSVAIARSADVYDNNDGKIDFLDVTYLAKHLNKSATEPDYAKFDLNGDQTIDVVDLVIVFQAYKEAK
ncbi:5'-nucleotidase C-terminal domain-containing protein [Paenibacillus sp. TRM 82003]|nr:5'-nucleotidase C-terminal domain-containing protein [Paenibacillus sp. TRM 82003]